MLADRKDKTEADDVLQGSLEPVVIHASQVSEGSDADPRFHFPINSTRLLNEESPEESCDASLHQAKSTNEDNASFGGLSPVVPSDESCILHLEPRFTNSSDLELSIRMSIDDMNRKLEENDSEDCKDLEDLRDCNTQLAKALENQTQEAKKWYAAFIDQDETFNALQDHASLTKQRSGLPPTERERQMARFYVDSLMTIQSRLRASLKSLSKTSSDMEDTMNSLSVSLKTMQMEKKLFDTDVSAPSTLSSGKRGGRREDQIIVRDMSTIQAESTIHDQALTFDFSNQTNADASCHPSVIAINIDNQTILPPLDLEITNSESDGIEMNDIGGVELPGGERLQKEAINIDNQTILSPLLEGFRFIDCITLASTITIFGCLVEL